MEPIEATISVRHVREKGFIELLVSAGGEQPPKPLALDYWSAFKLQRQLAECLGVAADHESAVKFWEPKS